MDYLSIGLIYFFEFLITISFCNRVMDKRLKTSKILIFTFPLYVLGFALYFIFENVFVNTCVSLIMYFCTMLIGYNETIIKKVVYTAYLLICMYLSEIIFFITLYDRYKVIMANETTFPITHLFTGITSKLINFILIQLLALLIKHKDFRQNKKFLPLFIYPMTSMAYVIAISWLSEKYAFTKSELSVIVIISLIDAIMCVVIFMYYGFLEKKDREIKELEKEQQFVELNNSYMQVLEHQNNEMRMMFHDTKNHYNTIANMNSVEEIHSYVDALFDDIQKYQIIKLTNNKMLDLLLSKYKAVCNSKRISFNIEVKTANLDYVDDSDLSILICNLLDNAVESAERSIQKSIIFSLRRVNTFDVLNVINSCDTEPVIKSKTIKTSKEDKSAHGYGIKIISKYAKKNNAEYEWHYDNQAKKFNSTLIFKR